MSPQQKIRNETRKVQKEEQRNVAGQCKQNPKVSGSTLTVNVKSKPALET